MAGRGHAGEGDAELRRGALERALRLLRAGPLVAAPGPQVGVHDLDRPEEQPVDPVAVPGRQNQLPRTASELEVTRVARVGLARAEVAEDLRRAGSFHRE